MGILNKQYAYYILLAALSNIPTFQYSNIPTSNNNKQEPSHNKVLLPVPVAGQAISMQ